jgi:hypothetical protein
MAHVALLIEDLQDLQHGRVARLVLEMLAHLGDGRVRRRASAQDLTRPRTTLSASDWRCTGPPSILPSENGAQAASAYRADLGFPKRVRRRSTIVAAPRQNSKK